VRGDVGHPGWQGGGHKKNNRTKWKTEDEEEKEKKRHNGSLTQENNLPFFSRKVAFYGMFWENLPRWKIFFSSGM
jgi:hypothetical protein